MNVSPPWTSPGMPAPPSIRAPPSIPPLPNNRAGALPPRRSPGCPTPASIPPAPRLAPGLTHMPIPPEGLRKLASQLQATLRPRLDVSSDLTTWTHIACIVYALQISSKPTTLWVSKGAIPLTLEALERSASTDLATYKPAKNSSVAAPRASPPLRNASVGPTATALVS